MIRALISLIVIIPSFAFAQNQLEVHEWGTITSYHLPDGSPRPGVNRYQVSADSLPPFVHRLEKESLRYVGLGKVANADNAYIDLTEAGHPDAIMRLETPVLYFHPPKGWDFSKKLSALVKFKGGLLNEFFPEALRAQYKFSELAGSVRMTAESSSTLEWKDFQLLASDEKLPQTDMHVWLAPRAVSASALRAANGEVEKYIFYRGVAALPSPLHTKHLSDGTVEFYVASSWSASKVSKMSIPNAWMIRVNNEKKLSFHQLGAMVLTKGAAAPIARSSPLEAAHLFEGDNRSKLRAEIKDSLLSSGLYDDEAEAMLNTWGDSYFGQAGLRVLYVVPQPWIEAQLPLTISVPAKLSRVLIGRIEIE